MKFSAPESFETALVTWGQTRIIGTNTLEITDDASTVRVTIDTQGRAYQWRQEPLDEQVHTQRKPVRIGITLDSKIASGSITLRIVPVTN